MTLTVSGARKHGRAALQSDPEQSGIDADALLMASSGLSRAQLISDPDRVLSHSHISAYKELLARRAAGVPVAYLLGRRGFWCLDLEVSEAVLIPRPETELLVERALELGPAKEARVLDLGTGSGAIALAIAAERPEWTVLAVDQSDDALLVAARNQSNNNIQNVRFVQSNWFDQLEAQTFDLIISNPPYIDANDPHLHSGDLRFEPAQALVAEESGLADLRAIILAAPAFMRQGAHLLLEHGWTQSDEVCAMAAERGFSDVRALNDLAGHARVCQARWPGSSAL